MLISETRSEFTFASSGMAYIRCLTIEEKKRMEIQRPFFCLIRFLICCGIIYSKIQWNIVSNFRIWCNWRELTQVWSYQSPPSELPKSNSLLLALNVFKSILFSCFIPSLWQNIFSFIIWKNDLLCISILKDSIDWWR